MSQRATLLILLLGALTCCTSTAFEDLEPGLRPYEVHALLGEPTQSFLAKGDARGQGSYVRKMLVEHYQDTDVRVLQLLYAIPADIDELAAQGDLDWAREVAPSLSDGRGVATLGAELRQRIRVRCARLLRYRRVSLREALQARDE